MTDAFLDPCGKTTVASTTKGNSTTLYITPPCTQSAADDAERVGVSYWLSFAMLLLVGLSCAFFIVATYLLLTPKAVPPPSLRDEESASRSPGGAVTPPASGP